jgi:hypothetical protein
MQSQDDSPRRFQRVEPAGHGHELPVRAVLANDCTLLRESDDLERPLRLRDGAPGDYRDCPIAPRIIATVPAGSSTSTMISS